VADRHEQLMESVGNPALSGKPAITRPVSPSQCARCLKAWPCEYETLRLENVSLRQQVAALADESVWPD
jgi:hypothetical protein